MVKKLNPKEYPRMAAKIKSTDANCRTWTECMRDKGFQKWYRNKYLKGK